MSRAPVVDWATDFDHRDADWVDDPFPIWDELRQKCPIAHMDRFSGVYFPSRYEDIRMIAYDPEHFSCFMPRRRNDCIAPLAPPEIIANIPGSVSNQS